MPFNTAGASEVSLEIFGSRVTEMAPQDLPAGVSPANQEVEYVPGSVSSRRNFQRVFSTPLPHNLVYAKSYVDPNGVIHNLYLASGGGLWLENVSVSPGGLTGIYSAAAGSSCKSVTAFGREYIAISDGLHGAEIPLQFVSNSDGSYYLDRVTQDGPGAPPVVTNVALAPSSISSISRSGNIVSVITTGANNLQVGYRAQISGIPASVVGGSITNITIDNEDQPGIATVTTSAPHGLVPEISVSITGVNAASFGGPVLQFQRYGGIVTATMTSNHHLSPGAVVTVRGATDATFNATVVVSQVNSAVQFVYYQNAADTSNTGGGTVNINWPVPDTATPTYFRVVAVPTANTFQVAVNYADGIWSTGTVTYAWDGTFFVSGASAIGNIFNYQQYGPDASLGAGGRVTPFGQVSPGMHQVQVHFLTRNGAITRPSPPAKFVANGGQYLSVSNLPIGPSNVVGRILSFTGADGAYFFYIPAPAIEQSQTVSTATQINDNTSTSVTLDFSDNTLFAATGVSIPGNDLSAQIVLDGCLSFGYYSGRLIAYGTRNTVQNFVNLGFDGGYLAGQSFPLGWQINEGVAGILVGGGRNIAGFAYQVGGANPPRPTLRGTIWQSAFQDAYGAPILNPNTQYSVRLWAITNAPGPTVNVSLSSASTGYSAQLFLTPSTAGGWLDIDFPSKTPSPIPPDLILTINSTNANPANFVTIDEISIRYSQTPYQEGTVWGSYVDNPEGFDGVTGQFGPADDSRKILTHGIIRDTLYIVTRDPGGRVHAVNRNESTEPNNWIISEVASNCGALSAFCLTQSQSDDSSASGGEEWMAWASGSGARMFSGDDPKKISQEIEPDWESINPNAALTVWALNDPTARVIYFGIPTGAATAPDAIYPLNYRELDGAYAIATSPPFHPAFSGRLVATDNTRKWTLWNRTMNGAALMYRSSTQKVTPVFFGGNGQAGSSTGSGNVYTLNAQFLPDDDYGAFSPMYTTFFFMRDDQEQALQLGAQRKMLSYLSAYVIGSGTLVITALANRIGNPLPYPCVRTLSPNSAFDLEWGGASLQAQRMAFQFSVIGANSGFTLARMTAAFRKSARLPIRGSAY